jgi:cell wall-associated NlpC family hydrolase
MMLLITFAGAIGHAGEVHEAALREAEAYLGTPWAWNGQATDKHPGLGCMSLVYRAYAQARGEPRSSYPVNPSEMVASEKLGGVSARLSRGGSEGPELLQRGDVVYFLTTTPIPDEPLLRVGGQDYWPWHMGLYLGEGEVLHSEPGGEVRTQALEEITWEAIVATRP